MKFSELVRLLEVHGFYLVKETCDRALAETKRFRLRKKNQLWIAWSYGTLVNSAGTLASYWLDLPTGQTLVFLQAFLGAVIYFTGNRLKETRGLFS